MHENIIIIYSLCRTEQTYRQNVHHQFEFGANDERNPNSHRRNTVLDEDSDCVIIITVIYLSNYNKFGGCGESLS